MNYGIIQHYPHRQTPACPSQAVPRATTTPQNATGAVRTKNATRKDRSTAASTANRVPPPHHPTETTHAATK